jgi:hypothetical protein
MIQIKGEANILRTAFEQTILVYLLGREFSSMFVFPPA